MLRPWADALALAALRKEPNGQTRLNRIAEQTVRKAIAGDMSAIREIGERLDGRVNLQPEDVAQIGATMQQPLINALVAALVDKKRIGDGAKVVDAVAEMVDTKTKE